MGTTSNLPAVSDAAWVSPLPKAKSADATSARQGLPKCEMKTEEKFQADWEAAKEAAERLVRLFAKPEPGLSSWHTFVGSALANLEMAIYSKETIRIQNAAPDMLKALKDTQGLSATLRDVAAGLGRNAYAHDCHAIAGGIYDIPQVAIAKAERRAS